METRDAMNTKDVEAVHGSEAFLYAMDPTTTLFTFLLRTDPSVNTVRLLGSWDNFSMTYAMERDSRRDRGQWRGCHTFNNIICDGDTPVNNYVPRSGGLKMGQTYYYYYEVNGSIETHDPAVPSTTTCPYLPGQRVNTLWVPIEQSSRQRSASVNSILHSNFQTMDPADKFVTPRPPPATPSVVGPSPPPASAMAIPYERRPLASSCDNKRSLSPLPTPRHLLRHQRSVRSLSPSPSLSTWSPRRLFARRASPSREVTAGDEEEDAAFVPSSVGSENDATLHRPVLSSRLVSSSSVSSISSVSRLRHSSLAPAPYYPSSASQGSRSRDISPESLRRFLVDDAPLDGPSGDNVSLAGRSVSSNVPAVAVDTSVAGQNSSFFLSETDDEDDDDEFDIASNKNNTDANKGHDLDFIDDDEHNFATSTTSETAPMTILSPPPAPSRTVTPPKAQEEEKVDVAVVEEISSVVLPLPEAPTRAPPAIPESTPEFAAAPATVESEPSAEAVDELTSNETIKLDLPQLNLNFDLTPMLAPPSPMSLSPMSMSSTSGALSFQSQEDDSDPLDAGSSNREPIALFLPPPEHPFQGESSKAESGSQQHRHHHHHLVAAALTGSTATLVPGNDLIGAGTSSGLDDLVDELGWMATAIQG